MIKRNAKDKILEMAGKFPVLAFLGPRQSGKTTLAKMLFPDYHYVSLENPAVKEFATIDPGGFFRQFSGNVILDEVQNLPQLFSYIQTIADESNRPGQFILSGSQNFLLLEKITQTLAGRIYLFDLLPLSYSELKVATKLTWNDVIFNGGYPRIYDKDIHPTDFYPSYIKTYVERDVRSIINVHDLRTFKKFLILCASLNGQIFNANSLSKDLGVSVKTVQSWMSILETSYIVFLLRPWHKNFTKRTVKSPKIYFYDTGLVCSLLGIESADELITSEFKGPLFENYAILEIIKNHKNTGVNRNYFYWRDSNGNEIDFIIEKGNQVQCVEMKASQTIKGEFIKRLHYLDVLEKKIKFSHYLFCTTEKTQQRSNETIISWKDGVKI